MKDYRDNNAYTNNEAFPNTLAVNSSGAGNKDGTKFNKELVNDNWVFYQALLKEAGLTPNRQDDTVENSQKIEALKKIITSLANTSSSGSAIKKTVLKDIIFGKRTVNEQGEVTDLPQWELPFFTEDKRYSLYKEEVDLLDMLSEQVNIDKSKLNIVDWNFKPYVFDKIGDENSDTHGALIVANDLVDLTSSLHNKNCMFNTEASSFGASGSPTSAFFQLCDETFEDVNIIAKNIEYYNNQKNLLAAAYASASASAYADAYADASAYASASADAYADASVIALKIQQDLPVEAYGLAQQKAHYNIDTKTFTGNKLKFVIYEIAGISCYAKGYIKLNIDMRYQVLGDKNV